MDPLEPKLRDALKAAHAGLTDEVIDQYETLLAQRFQFDPDREQEKIIELDRKREQLLRERMPKFNFVCQQFHGESE